MKVQEGGNSKLYTQFVHFVERNKSIFKYYVKIISDTVGPVIPRIVKSRVRLSHGGMMDKPLLDNPDLTLRTDIRN